MKERDYYELWTQQGMNLAEVANIELLLDIRDLLSKMSMEKI